MPDTIRDLELAKFKKDSVTGLPLRDENGNSRTVVEVREVDPVLYRYQNKNAQLLNIQWRYDHGDQNYSPDNIKLITNNRGNPLILKDGQLIYSE